MVAVVVGDFAAITVTIVAAVELQASLVLTANIVTVYSLIQT